MTTLDYWKESLGCLFDEHGVTVSDEQLAKIARDVEVCAENRSMFFGCPESPYPARIKELEEMLTKEQGKSICMECNGIGYTTTNGPVHSYTSRCHSCCGDGKI